MSPKIMVFRPNWEEFQNFPEYIKYIEKCGAHFSGLAKVYLFCENVLCTFFIF